VDFLELDELLLSEEKVSPNHQNDYKVPPTPRFSSLDNNPHEDDLPRGLTKKEEDK